MNEPVTQILFGDKAINNKPVNYKEDTIRLRGSSNGEPALFSMREEELSTGMLCIGGTGSGKTNAIRCLIRRIRDRMTNDDVMIVFDAKGDYRDYFYDPAGGDRILGEGPNGQEGKTFWNLFRELLADGYGKQAEPYLQEICRNLFKPYESAQQPFFANAARGILAAYLTYMLRKAAVDPMFARKNLNNQSLSEYFQNLSVEKLNEIVKEYPDLGYIRMYIGKGDSNQALGVLAELMVVIKDYFTGPFGEKGDFSVREFVRGKGGRILFLEYDLQIGDILSPIYSLLIDAAMKEALGRRKEKGNVYFILDEFKLLPNLTHMDDAVNFGRSMGTKVIAGLQAISQIYDIYGEEKARSISAGFGSMLAFRPNDGKTREFVSEYLGKTLTAETILVSQRPDTERREGYCVEDWELRKLIPGEAFVSIAGRPTYKYRFPEYVLRMQHG